MPDTALAALRAVPFYFMRHGETDWNRVNRTQGRTDVPLNATGVAQAESAAARLRGRGITTIACSPLQRAHHTADILARALGARVVVHEDLQEANFGTHEGEVMGEWFTAWVAGTVRPQGGESFAELRQRVVGAMNRVLDLPGPVLAVAHGAFFRAVRVEMGLTASVRTANGVPLHCDPGLPAWTLTEIA